MKYRKNRYHDVYCHVALFTRAWIEMARITPTTVYYNVALFTRAWIEIPFFSSSDFLKCVALFTRAWIEIEPMHMMSWYTFGRPFHEGVD